MNYLLALVFLVAGIACFVWYRPLYQAYAKFGAKRMSEFYGKHAADMGWDNPNSRGMLLNYKWGVIGAGLFFLGMAFYLVFGTIRI